MQTTTARQLLELVFEGHKITAQFEEGNPIFHLYEVATACAISAPRDFARNHLETQHLLSKKIDSRSANGTVQKRDVLFLTQSGVLAMVIACRKPAARRFRDWILDEVLPQLLKYGSYLPGASPAERLRALHRRWRDERAECIQTSQTTLADSGLMTLRAFRLEHALPARDVLPIASRLSALARKGGITPVKLTLPGHHNPANAWPRELLAAAVNSTVPRLPL